MDFKRLISRAEKEYRPELYGKGQYFVMAFAADSRGRIVSVGHNSYSKSHTKQSMYAGRTGLSHKQYLHAEIHAIIKAAKRKGRTGNISKLFVVRFDKGGNLAMARPCDVCKLAVSEVGIRQISYTTASGVFTEFL